MVYHVGILNSFLLLLYIQPSFLVLVIPIGFLTALLVVYGRLSADRESLAIQSCGFSLWIVTWPIIVLSLLMSFFMVVFMDTVLPWGNISFVKLQYKVFTERSAILVRERVFIKDFEGYLLFVDQKDSARDVLKNVIVEMMDEKGYPYRLILGKQGILKQDPQNYHVILELQNGIMQQLGTKRDQTMNNLFQVDFDSCSLDLNSKKGNPGPLDLSNSRNISLEELAAKIKQEKKDKQDTRYDETEFHKKFSLPFSTLAFAFIGIPLGLMTRAGSFLGPVLAVLLAALYDCFIIYGDTGGPMGIISPFMAMWLPNFFLIMVGYGMAYWLNHKHDFWNWLWLLPRLKKYNSNPKGFIPNK